MRTDVLGLQPGRVVGGRQYKGCCADSEVGWQGKLDKNIGYRGVQGGTGKNWMTKTLSVVKEAAQELGVRTTQPL